MEKLTPLQLDRQRCANKRLFYSPAAAEIAVQIALRHCPHKKISVYKCRSCYQYHLTSTITRDPKLKRRIYNGLVEN